MFEGAYGNVRQFYLKFFAVLRADNDGEGKEANFFALEITDRTQQHDRDSCSS